MCFTQSAQKDHQFKKHPYKHKLIIPLSADTHQNTHMHKTVIKTYTKRTHIQPHHSYTSNNTHILKETLTTCTKSIINQINTKTQQHTQIENIC